METNRTNDDGVGKEYDAASDEATSDVKDYAAESASKRERESQTAIIVGVAITLLACLTVFLIARALFFSGDEDEDKGIAAPGQIATGTAMQSPAQDAGTTTKRDPAREGASTTKPDKPATPETAGDLNLPSTQTGDWTSVVNPADRITKDADMTAHVQQIIDTARTELEGVDVDVSNPDPRLQDVANYYLYGNQQAVMGLVDANSGKYRQTNESLTVYDHARDGIYTFTYYLVGAQGGPGFLMAGWYDPVTDSLKVNTASQTR